MAFTIHKGHPDEYRFDANSYYKANPINMKFQGFTNPYEYPKPPEIVVTKSASTGAVKIEIKGETEIITREQFRDCIKELNLTSIDLFKSSFVDVCECFIRQKQYIEFEEIKR
jgi:hypothetical protein